MTAGLGAPELLRAVGLLADGPVVWGRPVPGRRAGVFVVELQEPRSTAPIELTRVGKWLERVPDLRLDGARPSSRALAARLAAFWLPSARVLFVGSTDGSIAGRLEAIRNTVLGDRRPHSGGHWLHALTGLERTRVWWAPTDAAEEYEDALLGAFAESVPAADRERLPDRSVILPFANLRTVTGERKATGLTNSLLAGESSKPVAVRSVVQMPPGAAEGAGGLPPTRAAGGTVRRGPRPAPPRAAKTAPSGNGPGTAAGGRPVPETTWVSADGLDRLRAEHAELTGVRRPEVIGRIKAAKELGDLKENADYTAAREEQSFLEGRIADDRRAAARGGRDRGAERRREDPRRVERVSRGDRRRRRRRRLPHRRVDRVEPGRGSHLELVAGRAGAHRAERRRHRRGDDATRPGRVPDRRG